MQFICEFFQIITDLQKIFKYIEKKSTYHAVLACAVQGSAVEETLTSSTGSFIYQQTVVLKKERVQLIPPKLLCLLSRHLLYS